MIKAVIFDIDGVLINGKRFSDILAKDYGITQEQTLPFFAGAFQRCLIGEADLREEIAPFLIEWGWKKSIDDFLWYWFTAEHTIDRELFAYIEVLKSKGIHVYVATNQEKYRAAHLWDDLGFSKVFSEMFSSAHLGHLKHNPKFFEKVMKRVPDSVEKEEIILWDDTPINIEIAQAFGLRAQLYTTFQDFKVKMEKLIV